MLERIRTIDNRIIYINIDRIIVMAPQKDGTYAVRLHGRTGCVFIDKSEAEKLAGTAFNREDLMGEVTLGVSF
jgi:hypothetical protein